MNYAILFKLLEEGLFSPNSILFVVLKVQIRLGLPKGFGEGSTNVAPSFHQIGTGRDSAMLTLPHY